MISILATRGVSTKLRQSPFTETVTAGVHSVVYRPGIVPVPLDGMDATLGPLGTFVRGLHRLSGFVFSYDGLAAQNLFGIASPIDLIVRYRGSGEKRKRTLLDVIFIGDGTVTVPSLNRGIPELIGVPFRMQIPEGDTLANHVTDVVEP